MATVQRPPAKQVTSHGQSGVPEDLEQGGASGCPIPLLDKETLLEYLPSLATSTLLGVTAIFVLTSNQSMSGEDTSKNKGLRQFLLAMPYALFLFALAGLAAAVAVKRKQRVLGCATGTLLAQLLCLVVMGGVVTQVRGEVKPRIVWPVAGGIIAIVLFVWSMLCSYPKCLRCLSFCCHEKEKVDSDIRNSEKECENCGGITVNGRSPNPAGEGAQQCPSCGGVVVALKPDGTHRPDLHNNVV